MFEAGASNYDHLRHRFVDYFEHFCIKYYTQYSIMIQEVVNQYEYIVMNIGKLIEVSGYRNDYIARKLGLTTVNFSAKKNRRTFTLEEVKKIAAIIDNEDVQDFLMLQEMEARRDDETVSHDELFKEMGWS
jgi:hypothetical protein